MLVPASLRCSCTVALATLIASRSQASISGSGCAVVDFERQQRGDGVLRQRVDRQAAGHIARRMAAHAVGDHIQPDRRAHRSMHAAQFQRQQTIFVQLTDMTHIGQAAHAQIVAVGAANLRDDIAQPFGQLRAPRRFRP